MTGYCAHSPYVEIAAPKTQVDSLSLRLALQKGKLLGELLQEKDILKI